MPGELIEMEDWIFDLQALQAYNEAVQRANEEAMKRPR